MFNRKQKLITRKNAIMQINSHLVKQYIANNKIALRNKMLKYAQSLNRVTQQNSSVISSLPVAVEEPLVKEEQLPVKEEQLPVAVEEPLVKEEQLPVKVKSSRRFKLIIR